MLLSLSPFPQDGIIAQIGFLGKIWLALVLYSPIWCHFGLNWLCYTSKNIQNLSRYECHTIIKWFTFGQKYFLAIRYLPGHNSQPIWPSLVLFWAKLSVMCQKHPKLFQIWVPCHYVMIYLWPKNNRVSSKHLSLLSLKSNCNKQET